MNHITIVLKQGIVIKRMCNNYILIHIRNTNSHLLQVNIGM